MGAIIEQNKGVNRLSNIFLSHSSEAQIEKYNIVSLTGMVKYLSRLKQEGTLSEQQFTNLMTDVCANFIENEVEQRISKYFEKNMFMIFS
jgi:hypothetical protein